MKGNDVVYPVEPFEFNVILANQGSGWDELNSRFVAQFRGVYCIHLMASVYQDKSRFELMLNGNPVANVHHKSASPLQIMQAR